MAGHPVRYFCALGWLKMADFGGDEDDLLAILCAQGYTVAQVAAVARVSERTVTRRLADADFRKRVSELRAAAVERALGRMVDALTFAVDKLRELLDANSQATQLGAARSLIELAVKIRENVELSDRVAELENRLAETREASYA